jgi:nucleotide-binding universal stress UspA family protein
MMELRFRPQPKRRLGRKGLQALILGSVAQKVLTHATIPVLVVKA